MLRTRTRIIGLTAGLALALTATTASAAPFLCPIVGEGTQRAPGLAEGRATTETVAPPAGYSLLPGKNQAGAHANPNAHNTSGPGDPDAGPGGNPDYSPIWPG